MENASRATISPLGLPTPQSTPVHLSSWRKGLFQCIERNTSSLKQSYPPKFKEILMMEEMFLYQGRPRLYGTTKHNEFFGENQWHFKTKFPLKLVMQRCLKKKKELFCSAKFPTILISLSFEPFNWQCQMQFVFCSKANALKWLSQYEPWQSLILLGLKGRLTTEYCSHMPSEFHDTMLRLLCKG